MATRMTQGPFCRGWGLPWYGMWGHCKGKGGSAGTFLGISSCHDFYFLTGLWLY